MDTPFNEGPFQGRPRLRIRTRRRPSRAARSSAGRPAATSVTTYANTAASTAASARCFGLRPRPRRFGFGPGGFGPGGPVSAPVGPRAAAGAWRTPWAADAAGAVTSCGDPQAAHRPADARLRDDPGDQPIAARNLWKPEPRLGVPDAATAGGRGLIVAAESEGSKKLFELTDDGRAAADKIETAPWDEITEGADPGAVSLRSAVGQLMGAVAQSAHAALGRAAAGASSTSSTTPAARSTRSSARSGVSPNDLGAVSACRASGTAPESHIASLERP